ncbi:MAG: D-alanyl-D-alanine carboxypeptidase [Clostridia bacterium]|nr:D-alanyl-D-alanine carboxypeptidase [Clostridia bacterium]
MAAGLLLNAFPALAANSRPTATPDLYPKPTLSPDAPKYDAEHPENLETDQLYCWSAILMEADSGEFIFEKNADEMRHPASLTKIMTVYLALTCVEDLYMTVTASERAVNVPADSTTMKLQAGEEMPLIDVLYGTMLLSANDGANVIAETVSGTIENFVELMNTTARIMGCTSTHFANAHGYTDPYHYTTARDMAIITREAMKLDLFRDIVNTYTYTLPKTNLTRARTITNTNELFDPGTEEKANRYYYPYANGVKTGTTDAAQYCFVGSAEKDGVNLISVVLYAGRESRWADTIKLMEYGFAQYTSITPIDLYNMNPITIETSSYSLNDADMGRVRLTCVAQNATDAARARITATKDAITAMANRLKSTVLIQYSRDFKAPVDAGEVMGTMTYFLDTGDPVIYNLVASRSVAVRENMPRTVEEIWADTLADPNPFPPLTADIFLFIFLFSLCIFALIQLILFLHRRRKRSSGHIPRVIRRHLK